MGTGFGKGLKKIINHVLDVVYGSSEGCILCDNYSEELLCQDCSSKLNCVSIRGNIEREDRVVRYYSCTYYSATAKELILRLKYKSDFESGRILAEQLRRTFEANSLAADCLAFVPTDVQTLKKRGFNQCEFLCSTLCEIVNKKKVDCLEKIKSTKDQIGLSGEGRWSNLEGCFKVKSSEIIKEKSILLIDDVITTGATAFYCAKAMLEAGCREVTILTVAKSTL